MPDLDALSQSADTAAISGSQSLGTPAPNVTEICTCPTCTARRVYYTGNPVPCVFNCGASPTYLRSSFHKHYKTHFKDEQGQFRCNAPNCNTTFSRWGELTRHYRAHCLKPTTFPCTVIGCNRGGANGFTRKDKLLSHKRNVHDGKAAPDQLMRNRKLATKA